MEAFLTRLARFPGARKLWTRFPLGSVALRVKHGIFSRPHYAYGVFAAANLAQRLKLSGISVVEFGVAGGRGLKALESIAAAVASATGVQIRVTGFDSGIGMPEPVDYRDLPHVWGKGFYAMEPAKLRSALSPSTELVIGDLGETLPTWLARPDRFPLGFVSFDLDYYSSTVAAFDIFQTNTSTRLPRVFCYFDDIIWPETACHNEFTGELCAIREFNERYDSKKITPLHLLRRIRLHNEAWSDQIYVFHDFQHPQYCVNVTPDTPRARQLPL
jgi:hypothetical protein